MSTNRVNDVNTDIIPKLSVEEVYAELGSGEGGISGERAAQLQQEYGKNVLDEVKKKSPVLVFLSNFTHLMAILLWVG